MTLPPGGPPAADDADALRTAREVALARIAAAEAHGYLTPIGAAEHRAFAEEATSEAVLTRLVAGLRLPEHLALVLPPSRAVAPASDEVPAVPPPEPTFRRISSVLGSEERKGRWLVPDQLDLHCLLGSIVLDLRGALVEGDTLDIEYAVTLGSIEIIVPPGVEVWAQNDTVLGTFEHKRKPKLPQDGEGFRIQLRGVNWMGSVEVLERAMPGTEPGAFAKARRWLGGGDAGAEA